MTWSAARPFTISTALKAAGYPRRYPKWGGKIHSVPRPSDPPARRQPGGSISGIDEHQELGQTAIDNGFRIAHRRVCAS
jgi:hypothetical protein